MIRQDDDIRTPTSAISPLGRVSSVGWSPRSPYTRWTETLGDRPTCTVSRVLPFQMFLVHYNSCIALSSDFSSAFISCSWAATKIEHIKARLMVVQCELIWISFRQVNIAHLICRASVPNVLSAGTATERVAVGLPWSCSCYWVVQVSASTGLLTWSESGR